jgi:hypothetical protein
LRLNRLAGVDGWVRWVWF